MHLFDTHSAVGTYNFVSMTMIEDLNLRSILKNDVYISRPLMAGFKASPEIGDAFSVLQTTASLATIGRSVEITHELVSRDQFLDTIQGIDSDDRDDELIDRLTLAQITRSNMYVISTMELVPMSRRHAFEPTTSHSVAEQKVNYHGDFEINEDIICMVASGETITHRQICEIWMPMKSYARTEVKRLIEIGEGIDMAYNLKFPDQRLHTVSFEEVDAGRMPMVIESLRNANYGGGSDYLTHKEELEKALREDKRFLICRFTPVIGILGA